MVLCWLTVNSVVPGLVVLGCIREQAEQAVGSKSVNNTSPWPLTSLCFLVSAFHSFPDFLHGGPQTMRWNEPVPPQDAFGHGGYHSKIEGSRTTILVIWHCGCAFRGCETRFRSSATMWPWRRLPACLRPFWKMETTSNLLVVFCATSGSSVPSPLSSLWPPLPGKFGMLMFKQCMVVDQLSWDFWASFLDTFHIRVVIAMWHSLKWEATVRGPSPASCTDLSCDPSHVLLGRLGKLILNFPAEKWSCLGPRT